MNKCIKCGTEFDGKFCPNCGAKWEDEKSCPQCGATVIGSARFCNKCGYSFVDSDAAAVEKKTAVNAAVKTTNTMQKAYSLMRVVPFAVFALFAVLLFAFYAAPVAELVMGMGFPNESMGNVYKMSAFLSDMPELKGSMITLIILLVVSVIYACIEGIACFAPKLKYKEVKIFGKLRALPELLSYVSFAFYLIAFVVGIAVIATVSKLDEGMDTLAAGSCPVLVLVFALIFALLTAGAFVARFLLAKKYPELAENELKQKDEYFAAEKARVEKFYATHRAPVAPVMGDSKKQFRKASVLYKYEKRNYDKAQDKKVSSAVVWLDMNKVTVSLVAVALVIVVVLLGVLIPIFTNIFRLGNVEKIKLGATKDEVVRILGEPTSKDSSGNVYFWYDSKVDDKIAEIERFEENADFSDASLTKLDKMYAELVAMEYKYIFVRFGSEEVVAEVFLDTVHKYDEFNIYSADKKEVESVNLQLETLEAYVDNDYQFVTTDISRTPYQAYYTDGSYYLSTVSPYTEIDSGCVALNWSDRIASYQISKSYTPVYEYLTTDGVLYINKNIAASAYLGNSDIVSVIVGSQVAAIGDNAFKNCQTLTSVTLPDSISAIGSGVFDGCDVLQYNEYDNAFYLGNEQNLHLVLVKTVSNSITSCEVPASTKIILFKEAFAYCASLSNITVAADNAYYSGADGVLYNKNVTEIICVPQAIAQVTLPSTVTSIGSNAFENCKNITSIEIGENVTQIGVDAFYGCAKLANITVAEQNQNYKSVDGNLYNYGCDTLIQYAVGKTDSQFTTPSGVLHIAQHAFYGCKTLQTLVISDGVESIGEGAIWECSYLTNLTIASSVTTVDGELLSTYMNVRYATVPAHIVPMVNTQDLYSITINGGTTIENGALWCAYGLRIAVIGDSVTTIESAAFGACGGLREVTIGSNVESIARAAFHECGSLQVFTVSEENKFFKAIDGNLYSYDSKTLIRYAIGKEDATFTVPSSVTTIASYAFDGTRPFNGNASNLQEVIIPDSVTVIEQYAFYCNSDYSDSYISRVVFENPADWSLGYMRLDEEKLYQYLNLGENDGCNIWWPDNETMEVTVYRVVDEREGIYAEEKVYIKFSDFAYFEEYETVSGSTIADPSEAIAWLIRIVHYSSYEWHRK